jgi:hypothetical protein
MTSPRPAPESRTAEIRALARTDEPAALAALARLIADLFGIAADNVAINHDQYSLNSLNGFFDADGEAFFFKFHQEEGEESGAGEYYRADILARAGLPVDQPVRMSVLPGEQMLIYRRRSDPRLSDVLRALDLAPDPDMEAEVVDAQRRLDQRIAAVYAASLSPIDAAASQSEAIHRLFHDRLVDGVTGAYPGGRLVSFYVGKTFRLPGLSIDWIDLSKRQFVVNGVRYRRTLGELFAAAFERLAPARLADAGGVIAHGDAHNANVWYGRERGRAELTFYDPAFAGAHVPSLLAEIKATFHNVFAHPFWLYDPADCSARFSAAARLGDGTVQIDTDWHLTALRERLLGVKAETVWRPLMATLLRRGLLPADWREVVRLALFLCPTLVMNLRAGAGRHTETSSAIALSVAVMVGSEPVEGSDVVTGFLDGIAP